MITIHNNEILKDALKWLLKAKAEKINEGTALPNHLDITINQLKAIIENTSKKRGN
jgi:hypothetical protein